MSWKELEEAATVKGGTSSAYVVSGWRVKRPVINEAKCTNCLICWIYCPEPAIVRHEAAAALGSIGSASAEATLTKALADKAEIVKNSAKASLFNIEFLKHYSVGATARDRAPRP
jgi:Pyruvate/2-oxoacid:ferredoxin oxidoreductase delta subunit